VPKKPNYSFEKRKKELDRKAKQEEKMRRKREGGGRDDEAAPDGSDASDLGPDAGGETPAPE